MHVLLAVDFHDWVWRENFWVRNFEHKVYRLIYRFFYKSLNNIFNVILALHVNKLVNWISFVLWTISAKRAFVTLQLDVFVFVPPVFETRFTKCMPASWKHLIHFFKQANRALWFLELWVVLVELMLRRIFILLLWLNLLLKVFYR